MGHNLAWVEQLEELLKSMYPLAVPIRNAIEYRIVQVIRKWAISKISMWVVKVDVQKPAEVLLNPKRMMILAINGEMALLHHIATEGVPSKHGMGGARY